MRRVCAQQLKPRAVLKAISLGNKVAGARGYPDSAASSSPATFNTLPRTIIISYRAHYLGPLLAKNRSAEQ